MRLLCLSLVAAAALSLPRVAAADDEKEAAQEKPKTAYLSFSVLHLARPIAELTGEMRLTPRWSFSVITGAGAVSQRAYWNVGTQLLAYPIGNFERGLQLGVETAYAGYAGDRDPTAIVGPVNALTFGPVIGFKWTFSSFTVSSQAGAAFAPGATPGHRFAAVHNLNIGWSF